MKRKFYETLLEWKNTNITTPLMVIGARQIGKTYIINNFCEDNFKDYIYINLDLDKNICSIFNDESRPSDIIKKIEINLNRKIDASNTVIFLDEIQVSERAISSLKYFCEDNLPYKIVCAGSLLGVKLRRFQSSFPVGKVIIKNMYAFDFEEFLWATGYQMWSDEIRNCYKTLTSISIHDKLIELYKYYLCIGGLPSSIKEFINSNLNIMSYKNDSISSIISAYIADMSKYTSSNSETLKIEDIYKSIPRQLGKEDKKFKYSIVKEKSSKATYESSIDWLISSNLLYKCTLVNKIEAPLTPYVNPNSFKLYFSDIGILTFMSNIMYRDILLDSPMIFRGAITENYVASQFTSNGIPLYYWRSGNTAEIDFIIYNNDGIIPVEVKSSDNTKSKSLNTYISKYTPPYSIRLSGKNFGMTNNIKSIPLYAVFCIEK